MKKLDIIKEIFRQQEWKERLVEEKLTIIEKKIDKLLEEKLKNKGKN